MAKLITYKTARATSRSRSEKKVPGYDPVYHERFLFSRSGENPAVTGDGARILPFRFVRNDTVMQ
jgi:hypothetical protein